MFIITATLNGQPKYYNAFNLMVKPNVLLTTPHRESAYTFVSREKAEEWKLWLEGKFPEYEYEIIEA